jgi:hypothetical protein
VPLFFVCSATSGILIGATKPKYFATFGKGRAISNQSEQTKKLELVLI